MFGLYIVKFVTYLNMCLLQLFHLLHMPVNFEYLIRLDLIVLFEMKAHKLCFFPWWCRASPRRFAICSFCVPSCFAHDTVRVIDQGLEIVHLMGGAVALVVLDGRLQQLALGAFLVEQLLHVWAREEVRLGDAENLERPLLSDEAASDPQSLLRHLLALLVAVLLGPLVVLLLPVVEDPVSPRSGLLGNIGGLLACSCTLAILGYRRRLVRALCPSSLARLQCIYC